MFQALMTGALPKPEGTTPTRSNRDRGNDARAKEKKRADRVAN